MTREAMTEPTKSGPKYADYKQAQQAAAELDQPAGVTTAADLRKAQLEEWGQFVAAERIYSASGALAFLPGHAVPASSVSDDGPVYPRQVARRPKAEQDEIKARAEI
jgi:hypothetical protein